MTLVAPAAARRVSRLCRLLPTILGFFLPTMAAAQTTLVMDTPGTEVNADTTIQGGGYALVNFSTSSVLASKKSAESTTRRILLKFDTQNLVPAGAVINRATLSLVLREAGDTASRPLTAYRVGQSFSGTEVNWLDKEYASPWSTGGGDLAERYTTTNVGNAVGSSYSFDLTQLVQRSVNGEFGSRYTRVALVDTGTVSSTSYRAFHSSRASNSALRPKLTISYGAAPASVTSTTLRVMQWNIHKTKGTDNLCNANRIADWVVRLSPQVVSMNEVNYYSGSCSFTADQGATLESLLEQKTGAQWYRKFVNADGGSSGVGNLILSRLPFASASTHLLSYQRGIVQAAVVVNGRNINVFSTHVDYYNSSYRTTQTKEAKAWAGTFAAPRIVMGDFNTSPGSSDAAIMTSTYADAWIEAQRLGTASAFNGTGATHGTSRFDYVYYTKASPLVLTSVTVPDTRSTSGVYPSDHDPVVAVFTVQ